MIDLTDRDRRMLQAVAVLFVLFLAAQVGKALHQPREIPYTGYPVVNISRDGGNVTYTWYSGNEQTFIKEVQFVIGGEVAGTWARPSVYAGTRTFTYPAPPDCNASVVLVLDIAEPFLMAEKRV